MRLSHRALPRTTAILASATAILAVQVEAVQGKQDPLEWTETSGGLLEWWHDPGVPLAFPVQRASS